MFAKFKAVKSLAVAPLLLVALSASPATAPVSMVSVADVAPVSVSLGQSTSAMGIGSN